MKHWNFSFSANGRIVAGPNSRNKNKVMFYYYGYALWTETDKYDPLCDVDPQAFPFDIQTCSLRVTGWMTDSSYVNYTTYGIVLDEFHNSSEWDLVKSQTYSFESDTEEYTSSNVVFEFTFKRRSGYYILTVIVPFIVVSVLGLLTFPLPPESGEKVSLGMTCLLSFFVIQASVSEHLPTSSHSMPYIGRFGFF